eukprot:Phypoly_transcript_01997.p1 GENE.Phypoly_transcript_01997~~Phypoly_transcript_01997.p1  ORF type:complete len:941 (-),score=242.88 Phypoly_transcript_01997:116-2938(-)
MGDPAPPAKKKLFNRRNKSMDYKGVLPDSINLKKLIENGNLDGLKSILDKEKTALRSIDAENQTLLHYACEFGQRDITKYLLGKGLDVNAKNKFGWTPIILAVCHGHLTVASELCRKDDIDMSPKIPNSSRNVLHFLGRHWSPDVVYALLQKCNSDVINAKDHQGDSPLHRVCIHGNVDCVKALVARSADVNLQNIHGETPLHYASRAGIEEIVSYLIDNGADTSIKGKYGTYQDVANSSAGSPPISEDLDGTSSSSSVRLAHSSSAPISYAALAPPSLTITPPSKLGDHRSRPSTPQSSETPNSEKVDSENPKDSESSANPSDSANPTISADVTVVAATVVVSTNEEATESDPPPLPAKSGVVSPATPKALPAIPAPTLSAQTPASAQTSASAQTPASAQTSTPESPASPTSPPTARPNMSQMIGTVGTAVGAALGSAAQGNFSMKGTVKKLVEGILSTDLELPGFDTKKLFQKVVQVTNFKDILVKEIVPQLKTKIMNTTLPAIAGAADTPIGEIQYEVWKISLSSLSFDDKSINCEPKLEGLKISMKMSAMLKNIHFRYSTHIMKDEGTATAEVQNISCVFILGLDIQNKQPKLKIKDTLVEMENLHLEIHKAKAKWLYNTIFGIISNKVKNQIGQLLTTTLSQQLSVVEGLFNDTLSLLWKKMRKKKKKNAKAIDNPDNALIAAQTATNLMVSEEILRIKAEIARTKLEVLKLSLPPPKGNEIKCYYYRIKSSSDPTIILVDMKAYETVSELQKFIISEYTSLDSRLFPSRIAASLAQVKNNMKEIMQIAGSAGLTAVAAASAAPPSLPSRQPELLITGPAPTPNNEQLIVLPDPSDQLIPTPSPPITPPTTPPITPPTPSSSSFTLPNFTIPMPAKIEINSNSNSKNKEKSAKKSVEWKFKDKEGDFVSITKRNTMQHIRTHAVSLHIFEKRAED